jgi:hypothetical protein
MTQLLFIPYQKTNQLPFSFRKERMGVRDDYHYSNMHAYFGNTSMINIDFVEIYNKQPVLAGDLKHALTEVIDLDCWEFDCYRNCFPLTPLTALVYQFVDAEGRIIHARDKDKRIAWRQYYPIALNKKMKDLLGGKQAVQMSELEWIMFLHKIRNEKPDPRFDPRHFCQEWKDFGWELPTIIGEIR